MKLLEGTSTQGLITKLDQEMGTKCYVDTNFTGGCNQEEGKDPGSVLSRMGYVITYVNFPIIWVYRLQTGIALGTTEADYIALY